MKVEPLAYAVKRNGGDSANPFRLSQARDAPRANLVGEFHQHQSIGQDFRKRMRFS